jgi:hypothetical protein
MKNLLLLLVITSAVSTFANANNTVKLTIAITQATPVNENIIFNVMKVNPELGENNRIPLSDEEIKKSNYPILKDTRQTQPNTGNLSKLGV